MVPHNSEYGCPKCGHDNAEVGKMATTSGGLSKMFDIQTNKFKTVTCANCGYTEIYDANRSGASDLADIFLG